MNNNNNSKNIDREFKNNIIKFLSTNIYNKKIIINKLYNQIKDLENELRKDEDKIRELCDHNWKPDRSYNNYDRTPYTCTICNLDRY